MNFDRSEDLVTVRRVLRAGPRYYVDIETTPFTCDWTIATGVNESIAEFIARETSGVPPVS